jgi:hypothetical protein
MGLADFLQSMDGNPTFSAIPGCGFRIATCTYLHV